jgi:hypothetical protein
MADVKTFTIMDLSRGRNGYDPPLDVPDDQCTDAVNVDWFEGGIAHKRRGTSQIANGGTFSGVITSTFRFGSTGDDRANELWATDGTTVARLASSASWATVTLADAVSTVGYGWTAATINAMLTIGYDTAQNRLHVYEPALSKVRRVGLATPAAPTGATLGGAGLTFSRYYAVRWVDILSSDTQRRSERSAASSVVSITDDSGVQVTRPTAASEDETHWEVLAADASTGPWYVLSQVAIGTTTYNDTNATIPTTTPDVEDGINFPPPSAKWVIATDARLLMAGCWETSGGYTTPKTNRVWFTPVIGDNDVGDTERIPTGNWIDFEEPLTGIGGSVQGAIYVFSTRRIWKLVPTGDVTTPYFKISISTTVGCIRHHTIVTGEDENGTPCLYFLSPRGPYRVGSFGLQYLGTDIEDLWSYGTTTLVANLVESGSFGVYHQRKHQVWWWHTTTEEHTPTLLFVFDTRLGRTVSADAVRGGWSRFTGTKIASAAAAVMFSSTIGTSPDFNWKPYFAGVVSAGEFYRADDDSATDDAGTNFQAYVQTKEYAPQGLDKNLALLEPHLVAEVASGVTITATAYTDFGLRSSDATGTALLTASGSETRVNKKLEGFQTGNVGSFSLRIGDGSAASNNWTLDALTVPYKPQEAR